MKQKLKHGMTVAVWSDDDRLSVGELGHPQSGRGPKRMWTVVTIDGWVLTRSVAHMEAAGRLMNAQRELEFATEHVVADAETVADVWSDQAPVGGTVLDQLALRVTNLRKARANVDLADMELRKVRETEVES
jgi:hypothetical protein